MRFWGSLRTPRQMRCGFPFTLNTVKCDSIKAMRLPMDGSMRETIVIKSNAIMIRSQKSDPKQSMRRMCILE